MWRCNVLVQLSHESSTKDATWPKTKASRDTVCFLYCDFHVDSSWFCYSDLDFVICWRWLPDVTWLDAKEAAFHVQTTTFWSLQGPFELTPLRAVTPKQPWISRTVSVTSSAQQVRFKVIQSAVVPWCSMTFESIWIHLMLMYVDAPVWQRIGQTYIEKTGRESLQCDHTLVSNLSTSMLVFVEVTSADNLVGPATDQEIAADRFGFVAKKCMINSD